MRYFLGIFIVFGVLATILFFSLKIWGIELFSEHYLKDGWIIFTILLATSIILAILLPFFFKPHKLGYDETAGNVAQPKKNKEDYL